MRMKIIVNNQEMTTSAATLAALAEEMALPTVGIALALNNKIVPRTAWEATPLAEGAQLTLIRAACGG